MGAMLRLNLILRSNTVGFFDIDLSSLNIITARVYTLNCFYKVQLCSQIAWDLNPKTGPQLVQND